MAKIKSGDAGEEFVKQISGKWGGFSFPEGEEPKYSDVAIDKDNSATVMSQDKERISPPGEYEAAAPSRRAQGSTTGYHKQPEVQNGDRPHFSHCGGRAFGFAGPYCSGGRRSQGSCGHAEHSRGSWKDPAV